MTKYKAICGNTSRTIEGCKNQKEALDYAIKVFGDCMDHTDNAKIYDMQGNFLCEEEE
jgi:hypothetical protein